MKSVPRRLSGVFLVLSAIIVPELSQPLPAAYADSEASSSAGSEASLEAGSPGRGRRRGGRRAYWRRQNAQANKAAQKEEQAYRARTYTGDHR
ncbi:hypothetical protein BH10CYA1_BH10CYA1_08030 [soil metagenome]